MLKKKGVWIRMAMERKWGMVVVRLGQIKIFEKLLHVLLLRERLWPLPSSIGETI
jgi:hypothetical protein